MMVFVKMHNEGGDIRGFLAYLRNAPCHDFVNDHPPVHWSDSGKSPEQGVGHSEGYPFWLFRIKDGHHELYHPPFSRIYAVRRMEALLRIDLPFKLFGSQTISPACPSLLTSLFKMIDLSPCIQSLALRIPPGSFIPLIASLK